MLIFNDLFSHPVQLTLNSSGGLLIFFHPYCQLCSKQRKYQPAMLMAKATWDYLSDPDTTHAGAFGTDYQHVSRNEFQHRAVSCTDAIVDDAWVIVWKFPGDLNYLRSADGKSMFKKILDVPLPVGMYTMRDDRWRSYDMQHPDLPKNSNVEKMRIDCKVGGAVHYLETETGTKVAMMGSHYFIREFWEVTDKEKKNVQNLIQALFDVCRIYAFPCYWQHHAIVFYIDLRGGSLISPTTWGKLILREDVRRVIQSHARVSTDSWLANYARLLHKNAGIVHSPLTSTNVLPVFLHSQPDPTGSLLRVKPIATSKMRSNVPLPNNICVQVVDVENEFSYVRRGDHEGWVRTRHLHPRE